MAAFTVILRKALLASACVASLAGAPALAQSVEPVASPQSDVPDDEAEIVVTAQRRESSLQNVAATLAVVTGAELTRSGVNDSQNLQNLVPGLVVAREIGMSNQLFIRGVGNNLLGISSGNSVATYIDGVYIPNSNQSFQVFNDVERVEVLKGPQAVLYGRNATGGALLITSRAPSDTFEGSGDISYGNYNTILARGSVSGPLAGDVLTARVSGQYGKRDAYGINLFSGRGQDFEKSWAIKGAIKYEPSTSFSVTVGADYSRLITGDFAKSTNITSWAYVATSPSQYTPDPRARYTNIDSYQPSRDRGVHGTVVADVGIGKLTSVTSYRKYEVGPYFADSDGVAQNLSLAPGFQVYFNGNFIGSKQFYHETFLATPSDKPFRATVGGNYFNEDAIDKSRPFQGAFNYNDRALKAHAWSVYADLSYDVVPRLTLNAGARYSYEKKRYAQTKVLANAAGQPTGFGATVANADSWNSFTPKFSLEYRPQDGVLLYASATKGFKSGGFNETDPTNSFNPETIWGYEVGIKSRPTSDLTANFSAFYYDYKDLQVQQIIFPSYIRLIKNASSAAIYGAEAELTYRPSRGLKFGANLAYLHGEYGDLNLCVDALGACTITVGGATVLNPATNLNLKGNTIARAPTLSTLFSADYKADLGNGAISIHGEATYRSRTYFSPYQLDIQSSSPYWLANSSIRYDLPGDRVSVSAYVQNIFDKVYFTHVATVARFLGPIDGLPQYVHYGAPRTYGVRLGVTF